MSHDVFISYSAKDKAIADAVCAKLENNKIRCWIAPRDILPGIEYGQALVEAIKKSRVVVLVLSSSSNVSTQVMREVERAVSIEIPIIPLRIENIQPSESLQYYISSVHWLEAITPPIEQHLDKLTVTVARILGGNVSFEEEAGEPPLAGPVSQRNGVETTRKEAAARQEAEDKARREKQARLERAAEEKSRREEELLRKEAEIKARQAAEQQARRDAQEREQRIKEQRLVEIARLQHESETALAGGEWGKARQLISQLKNLGPDGQALANRLRKFLPRTKIPGWVWAIGGMVMVGIIGIILIVAFLASSILASLRSPTDTPRPVVQVTENSAPQPTQFDTPTRIATTPTPTPIPSDTPLPSAVLRVNANVRAGPGTIYPIIGIYNAGTQLQILGRNHAGDWLALALPGNKQGWIAVSSLQVGFDINTLSELQAPPAPTLEPTPTEKSFHGVPATPTPAPP